LREGLRRGRRTGYCLGCRRTLPEIAGWARLSDQERADIMAALPDRPDPMASPDGRPD
jgi:predicted Fe-S protein YdhL (DUF1289 family)